jgi:hypothetical protein
MAETSLQTQDYTTEYTKLVPEILEHVESLYGKRSRNGNLMRSVMNRTALTSVILKAIPWVILQNLR